MGAIALGLIAGLLGVFINWLFKSWLDTKKNPFAMGAKPISFVDAKPLFLAKVEKKWWYGPDRMRLASAAYDQVAQRYLSGDPQYCVGTSSDAETEYKALAKRLVTDLKVS